MDFPSTGFWGYVQVAVLAIPLAGASIWFGMNPASPRNLHRYGLEGVEKVLQGDRDAVRGPSAANLPGTPWTAYDTKYLRLVCTVLPDGRTNWTATIKATSRKSGTSTSSSSYSSRKKKVKKPEKVLTSAAQHSAILEGICNPDRAAGAKVSD
ncbi:hypothetical protein LAZ40_04835 [Cereibacter sphaeroides]|uniref:hypothetical protein n=1 Tax=Cereibacter sphaeroides TaxID=1063 RepID=UPI001F415EE1|nr:hypothetical protein [Cereibacter sphaeroides]MCE6958382.1 hypothetical protein [Cereibacter sphaeroides]MCE6972249.1 hypothetical protein [Cereibacter sphaeroides]